MLHLEPKIYAGPLYLARAGPGRPGGARYDPADPWHALIVEPHSYGCLVQTDNIGDGASDGLIVALLAVLREGHASNAIWILFDADLQPALDLPVFDHASGLMRPGFA